MKQYTLTKSWSFALQRPHHIPQNISPKQLEVWLKKHTPGHIVETTSSTPFLRQIDDIYPKSLLGIQSPPVLFYKGDIGLLKATKIGVVGTRKCSVQGAVFTKNISQFLSDSDIVSISGLAYGIDEIVHQNAQGKTIGIMPCGFGGKLPIRTQNICNQIVKEGGLLLSEFAPNTPPRKWRFIQRNRIIAWLADELILVEAPLQSGALHTVRFAMEKEKKVWVVPSSPLVYSNHGGLELIAAGFPPLCHINQLSAHLRRVYGGKEKQPPKPQSVMSFSEFAHHLNMNTQQATKELIKLELEGKISTLPNGYFAWNPYSQN